MSILRADEHDGDAELPAEPAIKVDELCAHDSAHVRVEVGDVDAGGLGRLDLRPELCLHGIRMGVGANLRHCPPHQAIVVDEPRRLRGTCERPPPVLLVLGVEGKVNADVEARILRLQLRNFDEPRAWDHDRACRANADPRQLGERNIGAVARPQIILVDDTRGFV